MVRKGGQQRVSIDEFSGGVSDGGKEVSDEPDGERGQEAEGGDGDLPG